VARGETGRVWMYFAPLAVALAAIYLSEHRRVRQSVVVGLVVVQAVFHIGLLRMLTYGIDPLTVQDAAPPATLIPTEVRFGRQGEMQLLGYTFGRPERPSLTAQPGEFAPVTFYWKLDSSQPISSSYHVFVHIASSLDDTTRVVNHDNVPVNWTLPTSCWRPGQVVRDEHDFAIADDAQPGEYVVLTGLYDHTNQREFIYQAQAARDNAVALPVKLTVAAGSTP
jgi:hypothetical protein